MLMNIMLRIISHFKSIGKKRKVSLNKTGKLKKIDFNMKSINTNMMTGEQRKTNQLTNTNLKIS